MLGKGIILHCHFDDIILLHAFSAPFFMLTNNNAKCLLILFLQLQYTERYIHNFILYGQIIVYI